MLNKRTVIYFLVSLSVILVIINIFVENNVNKTVHETTPPSISKIEDSFSLLLAEYAIEPNWVKKVFVKKTLSDSLNYLFTVRIPVDISISSMIKDLNRNIVNPLIKLVTYEKKNYGDTIIKIYSGGILKLQASLIHSDKIYRKHAEYSFYVTLNSLRDADNVLKKINNPYKILIVPSEESLKLISSNKYKYALLIDDKINTTKYSLEENFSKQKLLNQIRSIIIDFGKHNKYLIDKTSSIYNSKIYSFLRDEFGKRGIRFEPLQNYSLLKGNTKQELVSLYNFYTTSLKGKQRKSFIIELNDFVSLQDEISKQLKKGDIIF